MLGCYVTWEKFSYKKLDATQTMTGTSALVNYTLEVLEYRTISLYKLVAE